MPINRDVLTVELDHSERRIRITRPGEGEARTILHTHYDLDALVRLSFSEAGRQIGEDILLSLGDIETLWPESNTPR